MAILTEKESEKYKKEKALKTAYTVPSRITWTIKSRK
tara:strand:- start:366 stop:476 length:111 start_codon:yes stop_codon:yes gene_type:complete